MIESMACGTPVIATRWGAVPEVVDHGRTGIIVNEWREMEDVLEAADALDSDVLRREVEQRFTPERMVADYLAAYEAALTVLEAPLPVRPRDPPARGARARLARRRADLHPRRHRDRRPPRAVAARGARDLGVRALRPVRALQLPPVRHDRPGRPGVGCRRAADREPPGRAVALAVSRGGHRRGRARRRARAGDRRG